MSHERQSDIYIKPRYPVDEPPTYRARCSCGWTGPERYRGITDTDWNEHEGDRMTSPLSPTEAATVARFDAAQPAPESWGHLHHWIGTHDHGPVCSVCGIAKPEGGGDEQECEHHSWAGLMELLDEHWPDVIFPTREDDVARDAGARIVSLIRWVDQLRAKADAADRVRELLQIWQRCATDEAGLREAIDGILFRSGADNYGVAVDMLTAYAERVARERAAAELRAAAAELHVARFNADDDPEARWPAGAPQVAPDTFYRGAAVAELALKFRADALAADDRTGQR